MAKKIATQREFTETFKMQAVGLMRSLRRSAASVANQLNILVWKLRNWINDVEEQSEKTAEQDELIRLRNENMQLKEDMEFLKKQWRTLRKISIKVRFTTTVGDRLSVERKCKLLDVSPSGYYQISK